MPDLAQIYGTVGAHQEAVEDGLPLARRTKGRWLISEPNELKYFGPEPIVCDAPYNEMWRSEGLVLAK